MSSVFSLSERKTEVQSGATSLSYNYIVCVYEVYTKRLCGCCVLSLLSGSKDNIRTGSIIISHTPLKLHYFQFLISDFFYIGHMKGEREALHFFC